MKHKKTDKTKILVVDDDEKILFAFKQVFKKEGTCASLRKTAQRRSVR